MNEYMKVLIRQFIINANIRGIAHPRGLQRTRKLSLKR